MTIDLEAIETWKSSLLNSGIGDSRTIVAMQPGAFVTARQWKSEGFL